MEPVTWTPPIPAGTAAIEAWHRLDPAVRRDLLSGWRSHDDPSVAAVAVGYARTVLSRPGWLPTLVAALTMTGMALAAIVAMTIVRPVLLLQPGMPVVMTVLLLGGIFAASVRAQRRRFALRRMEIANLPLLTTTPATVHRDEPLTVGHDRAAIVTALRRNAVLGSAVAATSGLPVLVHDAFWPATSLPLAFALGFVINVSVYAYVLARWVRPGRPVFVASPKDVTFPVVGLTLPWSEITEVRLAPIITRRPRRRHPERRADGRGTSGAGSATMTIVVFHVRDADQILGRLTGRRLRAARTHRRLYGSPLTLDDQFLDHTATEIAATITEVPVRRYGP